MSRTGVTFASLMALGPDALRHLADGAAARGFGSCWTAETTGAEAFATLAEVGLRQPDLDLGTGVLAAPLRTPQLAAMGAATLQAAFPDQTIHLGVGVSSPAVVSRWHGAPYPDRPVAYMREYLTLVRACLGGERVDHQGDWFSCRGFRLGVRLSERRPRLVLGALNRHMLRLAGELADGVLLNYLPAWDVPWCAEQVRLGEQAAGRPAGSCEVMGYVHLGVADRERAAGPARRDLFSYAVVDAYAAAFRRAGFGDEIDEISARHADGDRDGAMAAVSDRMIDAIDIVGDPATVRAGLDAYVTQGLTTPVVMPLPWGPDRLSVVDDTLEATAPGGAR